MPEPLSVGEPVAYYTRLGGGALPGLVMSLNDDAGTNADLVLWDHDGGMILAANVPYRPQVTQEHQVYFLRPGEVVDDCGE